MFNDTDTALDTLARGAFLTSGGENANVMTIGWGFIGYMWRKKVFVAPVRVSRHTRSILDETGEFTLSFPHEGDMKKELGYCGRASGRDVDKFAAADLEKVAAKSVKSYVIGGCELYYECKTLARIPLDKDMLGESVLPDYANGDMHILYVGKIAEEY